MRNITLSADATLIDLARQKAVSQKRTLNDLFRDWLVRYTSRGTMDREFKNLMRRFRVVSSGRRFSREEMNER